MKVIFMKLVYCYKKDNEFVVGQTSRSFNDRHKEHCNPSQDRFFEWFRSADEHFLVAWDLSDTQGDAIESMAYISCINNGLTPREGHRFPNYKVLIENLDKLESCPICHELGCSLSKKELIKVAYNIIECAECGKEHKRCSKNPDGEYICSWCYKKNYYDEPDLPLLICAKCGKEHKKGYKNPNGEYICQSCYYKNYYDRPDRPLITCAECGKEHKRGSKNPDGEYICPSCYDKNYKPDVPIIECAECGKEHKRNYKNPDDEYICQSCYVKKYKKRG
jgi:hypothetical protein